MDSILTHCSGHNAGIAGNQLERTFDSVKFCIECITFTCACCLALGEESGAHKRWVSPCCLVSIHCVARCLSEANSIHASQTETGGLWTTPWTSRTLKGRLLRSMGRAWNTPRWPKPSPSRPEKSGSMPGPCVPCAARKWKQRARTVSRAPYDIITDVLERMYVRVAA